MERLVQQQREVIELKMGPVETTKREVRISSSLPEEAVDQFTCLCRPQDQLKGEVGVVFGGSNDKPIFTLRGADGAMYWDRLADNGQGQWKQFEEISRGNLRPVTVDLSQAGENAVNVCLWNEQAKNWQGFRVSLEQVPRENNGGQSKIKIEAR